MSSIAAELRISRATVSRVLVRAGLNRLSALDPAPLPRRYERARPGELLHLDSKKLACIERTGHRVTGDPRDHVRGVGYEAAFVAVDDRSRVAFVEMFDDERKRSAATFLDHAARYYATLGVRVRCIMTDNAKVFRSLPFIAACRRWRLRHIFTKIYTPRTNGKAERFIQTALREWAYGRVYRHSRERTAYLPEWLHRYNWHRPHSALAGRAPISRLALDGDNLLRLHILIWWSALRPSNVGDWQQDVAKLSWVEVHGDTLTVHDVRNFDYRSDTDFTPRFEDRVYDLSKLRGFDIFLSYWGSRVIAHTIVSWDFADSPPLAISIETRKQKGQEYSAIEGFFRQYEIIYVAADERDIVRVRTNYRGEDVYLYKIKATPEQARLLLMDYVATMNALYDTPEFYNALVDNCTTNIYQHVKNVLADPPRVDWRLLANGYGDEMLYENGNIDTRLPFEELRGRSSITNRAKSLDRDPHFSQGIREGLPNPRSSTKEWAESTGTS